MRSGYYSALAALAFALTLCAAAPARSAGHDPHAQGETAAVVYSCPMHPEVKSKKKGTCPKCKMDLRPARAAAGATRAAANMPARSDMTAAHDDFHATSKMSVPDVALLD